MKKILSTITLFLMTVIAAVAQNKTPITQDDYTNSSVEMADILRQDGKIWVVVAVIVALWLGMTIYLFMVDKKVTKLEKLIEDQ